jgi:UDP-N-acetylmuramate dehydrogenase
VTASAGHPRLEALRKIVPVAKADEPLARHTTYNIGGPADFYVEVKTAGQLRDLFLWTKKEGLALFPIGAGSNLLVSDKGLRGVVVRLRGEFEEVSFEGESVTAGAGVTLPWLAKYCAEKSLTGAEPFVGVPGTVGGALMTNAGTPEGDIGSLVEDVHILDEAGRALTLPRDSLKFAYRKSNLHGKFVLKARLKLRPGNRNDIIAATQLQLDRRAKTQPLGTYNVGSIFKNPPGDHAARLVEAAGLKGFKLGGAQVSPRHANFIVNAEKATARDVRQLIEKIRQTVLEKSGVKLETEVWLVGEE